MNKYKNKKRVFQGETFDSTKELNRWLELKLLERVGEITELSRQVKFVVIQTQRERGDQGRVLEREASYIADFVYRENGELVVEDTKGYKTDAYILKRKLMLKEYGIRIRET